MKARETINQKSEILEPLHDVALELSKVDSENKSHLIEYTKLDIIAAAIVFSHILANKKAHIYQKTATMSDMQKITDQMEEYGERIRALVYEMTEIDLREGKKNG